MIYKYPLAIVDEQWVNVGSTKAKPLSVGMQNGKLVLWVLRDEDYADETAHIKVEVFGTGMLGYPAGDFIGTVQMPDGYVWHVFA